MKFLFVEPFAGAAGDMFLGALLDLGAPLAEIERGLRTLPLEGWDLSAEKVRRGAIVATKAHVRLAALGGGEEGYLTARAHRHDHDDHDHHHDHGHHHGHDHDHDHGHDHHHPHLHQHGRTPPEIIEIIRRSGLPDPVKDRAADVFRALALAEGRVHGLPPDEVHFHEVGAIDAIIDICSTVLGLWLLGVERIYCASATTGFGSVECAHGTVPVPAPATLHLMEGLPVRPGPIEAELLTPTGAALLRVLVTEWSPPPPHRVSGCGFGAGSSDWPALANVLRVTLGTTTAAPADATRTTIGEAEFEVDDMRAEALGFLREQLDHAGALDVSITAVQMKKNRPGHRLTILYPSEQAAAIHEAIFRHSTTFGFRDRAVLRRVLDREIVTVNTVDGPCRVKLGAWNGRLVRVRPEYEDVAALARVTGRSIDAVESLVLDECRRRGMSV